MDYIPSMFVYTPSPQKKTLLKRAVKHKQVGEMKRRRLRCQSRSDQLLIGEDLGATSTTRQISHEISQQNSINANDHEISQDFTAAEAILKKELEDERQKRLAAEDQVSKLQKEIEDVQKKLRYQKMKQKNKEATRREEENRFDDGFPKG